jgi:nucleoside-diphosphate-sugar epimerase
VKALITGATGFVGRHLVTTLAASGADVCGLSSNDVDFTADPDSVETALRKILESFEPDVVFHLAGPKPYADPETLERLCIGGTGALIRALKRHGGDVRLIAAGSSTEYGYSTPPGHRLSEDDPARPSTPYGSAKLHQTMAVLEASGTVLRLFNCIGPGQQDDVVAGRIVHQLAQGAQRLVLRETASMRDFLDVRDAVAAFVMSADSLAPDIYNVCSGIATSIARLIELAFAAAGIEPLPVQIEMPEHEGSFQCGDPSKLESRGWARNFEIVDSLRDAIEYERLRLANAPRTPDS